MHQMQFIAIPNLDVLNGLGANEGFYIHFFKFYRSSYCLRVAILVKQEYFCFLWMVSTQRSNPYQ